MTCCDTKDVASTATNVVGPRTMETVGAANEQWAGSLARKPLRYRDDPLHGQPSFLAAIAQTLSNIGGGTVADHLSGAQRLLEEAFRAASKVFADSDRERAVGFIRQGKDYARRSDGLLTRIAAQEYEAGKVAALVLGARYYKRIGGHLLNVLSSVVMPLHKIDYYDEDELRAKKANPG